MTQAFPTHSRANFERTDDLLHEIKGITFAFDVLHDADPAPDPASKMTLAKDVLLRVLLERLDQIDRVRAMEWAGQGGKSELLTADEIAAARGEVV